MIACARCQIGSIFPGLNTVFSRPPPPPTPPFQGGATWYWLAGMEVNVRIYNESHENPTIPRSQLKIQSPIN